MGNDSKPIPSKDVILVALIASLKRLEDLSDGRVQEGVTLCVNGILISGFLTTEKEYMRSHGLLSALDEILEEAAKDKKIEVEDEHVFHYIHLRGAHIYAPGQTRIPSDPKGLYWRGRLSSVDGFSVGKFGFEPPQNKERTS